ncbi:hypothetical protein EZV62_024186 [Acer yangbiense]|uniref:BSD domain-containing protein n=1 Tax=Acer yangbiense TaxID=1000413 RepID=A0A5C7H5E5_9ROSI|nr:hypothetical protein EZV62_024186 [Acer yangbiense]
MDLLVHYNRGSQVAIGTREDGIMTAELLERLYMKQQFEDDGTNLSADQEAITTAFPQGGMNGAAVASIIEISEMQQRVIKEGVTEVEDTECKPSASGSKMKYKATSDMSEAPTKYPTLQRHRWLQQSAVPMDDGKWRSNYGRWTTVRRRWTADKGATARVRAAVVISSVPFSLCSDGKRDARRRHLAKMELWNKARSFAEEAAKRSQELTKEAADLTLGYSKLSDFVSDASKRSKEIEAEASKRADLLRAEAAKRADQIKSLAENIAPSGAPANDTQQQQQQREMDLERFGVSEELREFVNEITITTFQDFPLEDDSPMCDVPTVSNVRKDLNEWQEKHASLVLSTVKEISKLRYALCPRIMKERKFWRIYFILVNNHVTLYEKRYMEDIKLKSSEQIKDVAKEPSEVEIIPKSEAQQSNQQSKTSTSSAREQELDVFLLGGESDEDPDFAADGDDGGFDDDLDKMVDNSAGQRIRFNLIIVKYLLNILCLESLIRLLIRKVGKEAFNRT